MFCPKCRTEYRKGFTTCADCDIPLVAELPPEPAPPDSENAKESFLYSPEQDGINAIAPDMVPSTAVLLKATNNSAAAFTIIGLLETNGIEPYTVFERIYPVRGMIDGPMPSFKIFVNEHLFANARNILDSQNDDSDHEWKDINKNCGKVPPFGTL